MTLDDILRQIFGSGGGSAAIGGDPVQASMAGEPPMYDPVARRYASEAPSMAAPAPRLAAGGPIAEARLPAPSPAGAAPAASPAAPAANALEGLLPRAPKAGFFDTLGDVGLALQGKPVPDRAAMAAKAEQDRLRANLTYQAMIGKGIPPEIAKAAIANPEIGKQVIGQMFAKPVDPLDRQMKEAQLAKLQREASGPSAATKFGKQGAVFSGPDGKFYTVQFAEDGTRQILPAEAPGQPGDMGRFAVADEPSMVSGSPYVPGRASVPLAPARGVSEVDTGLATRIIDKATGADVREIAKDVKGEARDKVLGREQGEAMAGMPKAAAALEGANAKTSIVLNAIAKARPKVSGWSVGYGSILRNLPASQARDLAELKNTIVANLGFEELQDMRANSPTGGALGQVAVQELDMLQKTKVSLEQSQSVEQFLTALDELEALMSGAKARRQAAFQAVYGTGGLAGGNVGAPAAPAPSVKSYTDKQGFKVEIE